MNNIIREIQKLFSRSFRGKVYFLNQNKQTLGSFFLESKRCSLVEISGARSGWTPRIWFTLFFEDCVSIDYEVSHSNVLRDENVSQILKSFEDFAFKLKSYSHLSPSGNVVLKRKDVTSCNDLSTIENNILELIDGIKTVSDLRLKNSAGKNLIDIALIHLREENRVTVSK